MTAELKGYAKLIAEAIGTTDEATLVLVEDLMRANRSGLDDLPWHDFVLLARGAHDDAKLLKAAGGLEFYCEALGIEVPHIP